MKRHGFTLVELVIIIVVIGILASIVSVSYAAVQSNARDSQRETTVAVIAKALERYHEENGEYPSTRSLANSYSQNTSQAVADKLGIKPSDLHMPRTPESISNPITSGATHDDQIAYIAASTSDSYGCHYLVAGGCTYFRLQYQAESGDTIVVKSKYSP